MTRPGWDTYFMQMADLVSTRGTCDRKQVGSVIVKNHRVIATGYNGSIPGLPHCDELKCSVCDRKAQVIQEGTTAKEILTGNIFYVNTKQELLNLIGQPHDLATHSTGIWEGGHDMEDNHCIRTIHSEINALADAARRGVSTEDSTIYINTYPCWDCFKAIVSAGIKEVVYKDKYPSKGLDRVEHAAWMLPNFILRQYKI